MREEIHGDRAVVFYRPVYWGKPGLWCTWGMQPAGGALIFPRNLPCNEDRAGAQDKGAASRRVADVICCLTGAGCDGPPSAEECTLPENYEVLVRENGEWRLSFSGGSGMGARLAWLYPETRATIEALGSTE